jgi:hypothetical protein
METNKMMIILKKNIDKLFENQIFITCFVIFVSVFASHFVPRLPKKVLKLFNTDIVKIIFMAFIAYASTKNMTIALVGAIGLIILIQSLRALETQTKLINKITESTQVTSDSRIKLIQQIIENQTVENEQKLHLINNVMNSIASDKHKFDTGMLLIKTSPDESVKSEVIDKLYSIETKLKPQNIINMSNRLLSNSCILDNQIPRIITNILKSKIPDDNKKKIIIEVLKTDLAPNIKIIIMEEIKNANISVTLKNQIIESLNV